MERENYAITINGCLVGEKFTWNSSRRFAEAHIREAARSYGCNYHRCERLVEKDANGDHKRMQETWTNDRNESMVIEILRTK